MFTFVKALGGLGPMILFTVFMLNITLSAADCSKYNVQTSTGTEVFNHLSFIDFRNVANPSAQIPGMQELDAVEAQGLAGVTSSYFNTDTFTSNWAIQTWSQPANANGPIAMHNLAQNVLIAPDSSSVGKRSAPLSKPHSKHFAKHIGKRHHGAISEPMTKRDADATDSVSSDSAGGSTMLSLISTRQSDHQSCAQIETLEETMLHASIRLSARVTGSPGACAGLFLYQSDSQESDIEILTSGETGVFHATNQPGGDAGATKVVGIPASNSASGSSNGTWSDWNEYRLDWVPGSSTWYVNGQLVDTKTVNVPTVGMLFSINLWSNGGEWTGSMPVGNAARLDVRWIEMVYNQTSDAGTGASGQTCTVGNGPNAVS